MTFLPYLFWIFFFPLAVLWAMAMKFRRRYYPARWRYSAKFPVLSVGNIHSGGSGKTPLVAEIVEKFREERVVVVSRGYRGRLSDVGAEVDVSKAQGAEWYGDEPWMLATLFGARVWVGKDRTRSLRALEAKDAAAHVLLDDGFQHLRVNRDIDIIAINTDRSLGEAYCLPLGDLREPLSAIGAAQGVVLMQSGGPDHGEAWESYLKAYHPAIPVFRAVKKVKGLWDGRSLVSIPTGVVFAAFCGIAHPERFISDVTALKGGEVFKTFPDHHSYSEKDVAEILRKKQAMGAGALVTTDKDWVKVADRFAALGEPLLSLRIGYEISDEFWYFLRNLWITH